MTIQPAPYTRIRGCPVGTDESLGGRTPHPTSHEILLHGGPAAGRLMAVPCPLPDHVVVATLPSLLQAKWWDDGMQPEMVEVVRTIYLLTGPASWPGEPSHYWVS